MDIKQRLEKVKLNKVLVASYTSEATQMARLFGQNAECYRDRLERLKAELIRERESLLGLIDKLGDERYKTIIRLHYFNGKSIGEIARQLHYAQKTVEKFHREAIHALEVGNYVTIKQ